MNLDILFLGKFFPKETERDVRQKMKTGMQDAANVLQWHLIEGLEANRCGKLRILNCLPVNSFPRGYANLFVKEFTFDHTGGTGNEDINVGYCNLTVLKQFVTIVPFKKKVKRWAKVETGVPKILFLYSANLMFLKLAAYVKNLNPKIKTVCLIADLPEFSSIEEQKGIKGIYNAHVANVCDKLFCHVDQFVLLTAQMAEKLKIKVPYIVMEGIATENTMGADDSVAKRYQGQKYVFYSGMLYYKFGIQVLLDAFSKIPDPDLKLLICGVGEAEEAIRQARDKRIVYLGKLYRAEAVALQRSASVLVNPRQNNNEFTKYSFPSKLMEYLSSGVPVVAYKLDGIPDEYDQYICYAADDTPETLAKTIQSICALPKEERAKIGERAKRFVLENKNKVMQTKKILEFICK